MGKQRIVFLTGTRADYGKLKSLISVLSHDVEFEVSIFATGMHLNKTYGYTVNHVEQEFPGQVFKYINHCDGRDMEITLARTIEGISLYLKQVQPEMLIVHGDRVEALAGAIAGALQNIYVGHVEGGEVSGTIDELIRHAVTKLSHVHFVANSDAQRRLIQLGEVASSVEIIGSPDLDVMNSESLPSKQDALKKYEIPFESYGILMHHPVTSELELLSTHIHEIVNSVINSQQNFVVIYPNNDSGCEYILKEYERFKGLDRVRVFPSIRFEYFLTLLKNSKFIVGNSSAGIREAPYYNVMTINLGSRQRNRGSNPSILNVSENEADIISAMKSSLSPPTEIFNKYGEGNSSDLFHSYMSQRGYASIDRQKQFVDMEILSERS